VVDLDAAAARVFRAIGVTDVEQRSSSNYVDGRYFRSLVDGFWVCLALSDEVLDGYPYMLWVSKSGVTKQSGEAELEQAIATKLNAAGLGVAT
jgi:hypothetical protein